MSLRLSGGRRLQSPPGVTARPTSARVRQAVLNLLAADLPDCRWLDLCCGSGVMACEALQRGASEVVGIERDRRVAAIARANLDAVAAGMGPTRPRLRLIQAEAHRWLSAHAPAAAARSLICPSGPAEPTPIKLEASAASLTQAAGRVRPVAEPTREQPFDLIYLDPPWPARLHVPLSQAVIEGGWIRTGGTLVWECPSDQVPETPSGWYLGDLRRYGGSSVVLLKPVA